MRRAARAVLVLWVLAACSDELRPRTQVMLQVDADTAVRAALRELRVNAQRSDDQGEHWVSVFTDTLAEPKRPGFRWPARLALVPEPGHPKRMFALEVAALAADGSVLVRQRAVSHFDQGKTKLLQLQLEDACLGKAACDADDCVGSDCQTCRAGACVAVGFLAQLPDFDPDPSDAGRPGADGGKGDAGRSLLDAGRKDAETPDGNVETDARIEPPDASNGHGGAGAGGQGGAGGKAPATGFRIEAVTPAADSSVEPDQRIEVTFSEELEGATLDETSFALTRDGQAVAGSFEISARKVTFTPLSALALAAKYRVELSAQLRDRRGRALEPKQLSFGVRDGAWSVARLNDATDTCDPYVAVANNGFATMVFSKRIDTDAGLNEQIWARRYPLAGATWAPEEQVAMNNGRGGFRCRVAVNNLGYAVAAWDYADGVLQSGWTTGPTWSPERLLDGAAYGPAVALTQTDRAYVVMQFAHQVTSIQGFTITAGQGGSNSYALSHDSFGSIAQLALLEAGAMAVWQQDTVGDAAAPGSRIWAAGMGQLWCNSNAWSCPKLISGVSAAATAPQIASDPAHTTVIAVWQQADATWSHIWASRLVAGGNWSEPVRVSDDSGSASAPVVAVDRNGRARALWQQTSSGISRILSAHWVPGQAWSSPVFVSLAATGQCAAPALAVEPGGNALVAWNQVAEAAATGELWVGRYVEGSGWQNALRMQLSAAQAAATPAAGVDDAGRGFVTWYEAGGAWAARFQ